MNARRLFIAGSVLTGVSAAALFVLPRLTSHPSTTPTTIVSKQAFERIVTAEGNLRAVKSTPLQVPRGSRRPLRVSWTAEDSSRVKKGDVVVKFDASEMQQRLDDGAIERSSADAKISQERINSATLLRARDREAKLAKHELDEAKNFQKKDVEIFSRNQIIESDIDATLSRSRMENAEKSSKIEAAVARSKVALLQIERRQTEQSVALAKRGLADLEIRAPHDGIFVLQRNWRGEPTRVGDSAWPGQAVAKIPLVEKMEAQVFVLEADASGLEKGKEATVVLESNPQTQYAATIEKIDTLAKPRFRDHPVRYFSVTLSLERTDTALMKPGQRVRAALVLAKNEAIVLPRQAVFHRDDKIVVFRRGSDGTFSPAPVTLGSGTPGRVVIETGIDPGDEIALRDPNRSADDILSDSQSSGSSDAPDKTKKAKPASAGLGGK